MQNNNNSHTKRGLGWYIDKILNLFLMFFGAALIWIFLQVTCIATFKIPSDSMEPSLLAGDNILATPAMEGKEKEVSNCDIELSHVTFAYNQENVIKDISCKIPQGSVTALVGPSGSGKSIW